MKKKRYTVLVSYQVDVSANSPAEAALEAGMRNATDYDPTYRVTRFLRGRVKIEGSFTEKQLREES